MVFLTLPCFSTIGHLYGERKIGVFISLPSNPINHMASDISPSWAGDSWYAGKPGDETVLPPSPSSEIKAPIISKSWGPMPVLKLVYCETQEGYDGLLPCRTSCSRGYSTITPHFILRSSDLSRSEYAARKGLVALVTPGTPCRLQ